MTITAFPIPTNALALTTHGRALAEAASVAAQRTALGLGGAALIAAPAIRVLAADETKVDDDSLQWWFASERTIALDANSTYEIGGELYATTGTTSHALRVGFNGLAGASIQWQAIGAHASDAAQATALRYTTSNSLGGMRQVTSASTVAGNVVKLWGIVRTTTAGNLVPRVEQSAASGAFTILAGTMFMVRKLGADTLTNTGEWT